MRVWGITHNEAVEPDLHCGQKRKAVETELLHKEKAAVSDVDSLETRQGRQTQHRDIDLIASTVRNIQGFYSRRIGRKRESERQTVATPWRLGTDDHFKTLCILRVESSEIGQRREKAKKGRSGNIYSSPEGKTATLQLDCAAIIERTSGYMESAQAKQICM